MRTLVPEGQKRGEGKWSMSLCATVDERPFEGRVPDRQMKETEFRTGRYNRPLKLLNSGVC
jgi:hypothetical protein